MSEQPDEYEIRARVLRILAKRHRLRAAALEASAEMVLTTRSIERFMNLLTEAEARDVAEHPDLAELNVQLDGFYSADPARPREEPTA
ncbi:hypothetical protein [Streptomyces sp. CBMA152]|uniref:hypothetical protein n=1 Tax=Streptomyces sp. CBMA152 TaxID=1896312 RepID=UPI0021D45A2E|nr:hypothetical protein [Streptomyces sp. CBMA152]MBD0743570.1 hypothetical protein [Streptomyces sp. CBMA152]